MAQPPGNIGSAFAQVIEKANTAPLTEQQGKDLADGFPFQAKQGHKVVDQMDAPELIRGAVQYPYKIHRAVFTIYRPWGQCNRCMDDIATNQVVLPPDGDYTCPHTQKAQYEQIMDECLRAKFLLGTEQEIVQRDGTIVVSMSWYEKKMTSRERREAMKRRALGGGQQDEPPV